MGTNYTWMINLTLGSSNPSGDFASRHNIVMGENFKGEETTISIVVQALEAIYLDLKARSIESPPNDELYSVLLVMLNRIHHHVEAALVAIVTESSMSANVLSRTIIELSINFLYILRNDQEKESWVQYCSHFLKEEDKRIRLWEAAIPNLKDEIKQDHEKEIKIKRDELDKYTKLLENGFREINAPAIENLSTSWPESVIKKFEALGQQINYRTIYSVLSSEVHSDARAAVVNFAILASGDLQIIDRFDTASLRDDRLNLYLAIRYYLYAALRFARRFDLEKADRKISDVQKTFEKRWDEL